MILTATNPDPRTLTGDQLLAELDNINRLITAHTLVEADERHALRPEAYAWQDELRTELHRRLNYYDRTAAADPDES